MEKYKKWGLICLRHYSFLRIQITKNKIGVLIGIGMSYQQVKTSLTRNLNA